MAYLRSLLACSLPAFALCFACSNSAFEAGAGGGPADSAGSSGSSGTGQAGISNSAGESSAAGSASGGAGGSASGGASGSTDMGGSTSAGASGAVTGSGGASVGSGGASAGGTTSTGGTAGAADCVTLKAEYSAAVTKARVCDAGSTSECSASSTLPAIGCGCPTPVNAKSKDTVVAQKIYNQIQSAECNTGAICNIACLPVTSVSCAAQTSGTDTAYVCTGSLTKAN